MEPVTEQSNKLSADIDLASNEGIVRILSQCDAQIFTGWKQYKSLYQVADTIEKLAQATAEILKCDKGGVVLSGCGTSGRLGFVVSRTFNQLFPGSSNRFCYTIAGGDRALLLSTEAPEDSWESGVKDLQEISSCFDRILFIGITCGLSAPYVAGQLDYCINHLDKYTPVLLGFNTVEQARQVSISNWNKTFHDVASSMEQLGQPQCYIINPIVGPEPITGSSRMKSGSVTKIILETLFFVTLGKYHECRESTVESFLMCYEMMCRSTYIHSDRIAQLVQLAGETLSSGGRVCYIGRGNQGIMAAIDASECPPTYGASYDDIRGFLVGGWSTLNNSEGDLAHRGPLYHLDVNYFESEILTKLTCKDLVLFVGFESEDPLRNKLHDLLWSISCKVGGVTVTHSNMKSIISQNDAVKSSNVNIILPTDIINTISSNVLTVDSLVSVLSEMCIKWCLNAISTGAHVIKGKVMGNRMIDLQVSNSKLYYRSIGIIQEVTGVERDVAERNLLMSIYDSDKGGVSLERGVSDHIAMATGKPLVSRCERGTEEKVVPTAILMIKKGITCIEAREWLQKQPVLRRALN